MVTIRADDCSLVPRYWSTTVAVVSWNTSFLLLSAVRGHLLMLFVLVLVILVTLMTVVKQLSVML